MNNLTPEYKDKTTAFYRALGFVSPIEGGYANNPNDNGGETYCGIARKSHPSWSGWPTIDDAKEIYPVYKKDKLAFNNYIKEKGIAIKVQDFYRENFWKPLQLDKISNEAIAIKIFEMSINLGIGKGASIVQKCLNLMIIGDAYELKVDNVIGKMTVKMVNDLTAKDDGQFLLKLLTLEQGHFYMKICYNNPSQEKFLKGWVNRLKITIEE